MQLLHSLPPQTLFGLEQDFSKARFVAISVPFDSTVCFKGGARFGPSAIIEASLHLEEFDAETGWRMPESLVFTTRGLEPCRGDAKETARRVKQAVGDVIDAKKIPFLLGGEHSVTIGAVQALAKKEKNFSVLSLDAHADLRDEQEGSRYAHGCVMRRAFEASARIVEAGVRSYGIEEKKFIEAKKNKSGINDIRVFSADEIHFDLNRTTKKIVSALGEKIYLSIDLDVFDPSLMPATGCPEPNGLAWREVMTVLKKVCSSKKILGLDLVEFAPVAGIHAADAVAAKTAFKTIQFIYLNKK